MKEFIVETSNFLKNRICFAAFWGYKIQKNKIVITKMCIRDRNLITLVPIEKNVGLGLALEKGVKSCKYELIARMDTDDIAREDRFEKQLRAFMDDPQLDICGSHIKEFEGDKNYILSLRKVPLTQDNIVAYQKRRSAFNHMTVMYKKSSVIKAGNYEHAPLMEDDMLWTRIDVYKRQE